MEKDEPGKSSSIVSGAYKLFDGDETEVMETHCRQELAQFHLEKIALSSSVCDRKALSVDFGAVFRSSPRGRLGVGDRFPARKMIDDERLLFVDLTRRRPHPTLLRCTCVAFSSSKLMSNKEKNFDFIAFKQKLVLFKLSITTIL